MPTSTSATCSTTWRATADTRSILLYIESIESTAKFMSAARAAARNKPVIVVKAGRAGRGMAAAASHTGALAGSDLVFDAAIRRGGMLRVDTLGDLFMAAETLARFGANARRPADAAHQWRRGRRDGCRCGRAGRRDAGRPRATTLRARLDAILPPNWSKGNPIDIIGDAPVERYTGALQAVLADRSAGAVLLMHAPTAIVRSEDIARACAPIVRGATDRVLACWLGGDSVAAARQMFEDCGVATLRHARARGARLCPARHLPAQPAADARGTDRERERSARPAPPHASVIDAALAQPARSARRGAGEDAAARLRHTGGRDACAAQPTADAAVAAAQRIGWPVALKILSPQISHKSDVGGVALDLHDEPALRAAAHAMLDRWRANGRTRASTVFRCSRWRSAAVPTN